MACHFGSEKVVNLLCRERLKQESDSKQGESILDVELAYTAQWFLSGNYQKGATPLMAASVRPNGCSRLLLSISSVRIGALDSCGWSACHYAASAGNYEALEQLAGLECDFNIRSLQPTLKWKSSLAKDVGALPTDGNLLVQLAAFAARPTVDDCQSGFTPLMACILHTPPPSQDEVLPSRTDLATEGKEPAPYSLESICEYRRGDREGFLHCLRFPDRS